MTKAQRNKCLVIVSCTSISAAGVGAGLAQLPCADAVALTPLEAAMVIALGGVFGIRLNQSSAEATLAGATATMCGRGLSQALIGWFPVVGNVCDAATAAIVVQLVGWAVAKDFDCRANSRTKGKEKDGDKNVGYKET